MQLSLPVRGAWIEMPRFAFPPPRSCRSPCGERGLKSFAAALVRRRPSGRSPCGERGLKFCRNGKRWTRRPSLPVRGAWIEIAGRSGGGWRLWSLPVRGAWIEICRSSRAMFFPPSLPVRGAWIEMHLCAQSVPYSRCRSPCGERGLKFGWPSACLPRRVVAPRAGSVD